MSKAKFLAAKELIQEKKYDEARAILRTINDPTAQKWLKKLDKLAPEVPQEQYARFTPPPPPRYTVQTAAPYSQAETRYYERENRRAGCRSLYVGFSGILRAVILFGLCTFLSYPRTDISTGSTIIPGWGLPFGLFGLIFLGLSIWRLREGNRL
jgi:hypothetical protein